MTRRNIERVLIAARGGEGMSILRAVEASGREGVLLMSDADAARSWVDEVLYVVHVPAGADGRWPDWDRVASSALDAGCDALHPGYGPLAANPALATRLGTMNVAWLGAPPDQLELAADWTRFHALGREASLRTLPAIDLPDDPEKAMAEAESWLARWGAPARMRVRRPGGWVDTYALDREGRLREQLGTGHISLLHLPPHARILEVPVVGDGRGGVIVLGDREIVALRNGHGVLAEAPAAELLTPLRAQLAEDAVRLLSGLRWSGVGAVVFVVTADGRPFLRELRAGLSPWFGATEAVFGVDLVDAQLRLAEGDPLGWSQEDVAPSGAAMVLRLFAEGPSGEPALPEAAQEADDAEEEGEAPAVGGLAVRWVTLPEALTVDLPLAEGDRVAVGEELGLVRVPAPTRQACIVRAKRALDQLEVGGIAHTGAFLSELMSGTVFWRGPLGGDL